MLYLQYPEQNMINICIKNLFEKFVKKKTFKYLYENVNMYHH